MRECRFSFTSEIGLRPFRLVGGLDAAPTFPFIPNVAPGRASTNVKPVQRPDGAWEKKMKEKKKKKKKKVKIRQKKKQYRKKIHK